MNKLLSILISFSLIYFNLAKAQEYNSSHLFPVYGTPNYHGNQDCKPTVAITSDSNFVKIKISVIDDSLVINKDHRESDHVEIWFNMDPKPNDFFVYNKEFYIGNTITSKHREEFRSFLKNKTTDPSIHKVIDTAELPIVKELNGMVHWAFNLKDETIFLYDTEYYLKLPIKNEVRDKINFHKTITATGYEASIELKPEALFFMRNKQNKELTFMVDVFDIDNSPNDLSVLSTSSNRKWGAPEVFTTIKLKKPLTITLNPTNNVLKKESPSFYIYNDQQWRHYYLKTNKNGKDSYYTYEYIEF